MKDKDFWDKRYSTSNYLYGTEPNAFLASHAHLLQGPVLSLSEGEGRNAVFLATKGLRVLGVDLSEVALKKALALAKANNVVIETEVADLASYEPPPNYFNSVISISAHLPSQTRKCLYPKVEKALKPGGILLLEAYSEAQLARDTGGPKDIDMLMNIQKIKAEFLGVEPILLKELRREVREGRGHSGLAEVVQFIARKTP